MAYKGMSAGLMLFLPLLALLMLVVWHSCLNLPASGCPELEQGEHNNDDNKDHCFGLANTFNPGAVKHGVHNVQCHHFSAVARRTIRQRQVLVKHFERVSEGQEQTNRDRRHHHRDSHVPKHTPLGRTI